MDDYAKFLSDRIKKLTPYTAGEQPKERKYIKLNTNENPYPPTPKIMDAIQAEINNLHLYPDPNSTELCEAVAKVENVGPECVFCGNGSDEILSFVFYSFFSSDPPLLFPDITYSFYPVYANYYDIKYKTVPLNDKFEIVADDYMLPASGIIFPNPNAPTSVFLGRDKILRLAEYHLESVVAVDEAYIAFGGESMTEFVNKYPNLLVIKTLSKSHALAGIRAGFAIGQPHLVEALKRAKDSFNSYPIDRIASAVAKSAILDAEYYKGINGRIIDTRENFVKKIKKLGFACTEPKSNFVFATHESARAGDLYKKLKERGILVRYFDKRRIDNYLRITIGTDENMDYLAEVLSGLV